MVLTPDFSKETLDGQAAEIGPGAWVLGMDHTAGGWVILEKAILGSTSVRLYFRGWIYPCLDSCLSLQYL